MGADGVEVAQRYALDAGICLHAVAQEVLAHLLRVAVGGGGGLTVGELAHGQLVRLAVDGGGGGEKDVATLVARYLKDIQERGKVVDIVLEGIGDRLTHCLEGCKVDDGIDLIGIEESADLRKVAEIHLHEGEFLAGDGTDAFVVGLIAV